MRSQRLESIIVKVLYLNSRQRDIRIQISIKKEHNFFVTWRSANEIFTISEKNSKVF